MPPIHLMLSAILALSLGCKGDKGDPGPAGSDGAPGETGPPGADGAPGQDAPTDGDTAVDSGLGSPAADTGDTGDAADTGEPPVDGDGDGFAADVDCNDIDPTVNPDAEERCDGIDNNCDGLTDTDASDRTVWYIDRDADGYGDARFFVTECDAPSGYVADSSDCDDLSALSHPSAEERCDEADNDCDFEVDEGVRTTWYEDTDGDGYGNGLSSEEACTAPPGFVFHSDDCDDTDPATHPGALERCDDADNDCNGTTDDGAVDATAWYADADSDGYGDRYTAVAACAAPEGFVGSGTDCNDGNELIHPDSDEVCDGVDNDCDGGIDADAIDATRYFVDADADGYGAGDGELHCALPDGFAIAVGDCNDEDATVNPDATEVCDAVDNNCNDAVDDAAVDALAWYGDGDGDGFGTGDAVYACAAPLEHVASNGDCDDSVETVFPGAVDAWYDGVDSDCGEDDDFDADADGHRSDAHGGEDCLDTDSAVVPDSSGQCALGANCLEILDLGRADGDRAYTIDPDGRDAGQAPFDVECDMSRDGGGWTQLTGRVLMDQDWVHFSHEGGPGVEIMDWSGEGEFTLVPSGSGCNSSAARATATVPFSFSEWSGSWAGRGMYGDTHQDDNRSDLAWGEVTTNCQGHTKFGSETRTEKIGGEWGGDWNAGSTSRTWEWGAGSIPTATQLRWEVVDQGPNEGVVFYDIDIWVR